MLPQCALRTADSFSARLPGAGTSRHSARNVAGNRLRKRNRTARTRRLRNFSGRWIQRIAEFHGRLLWHGESARNMRVPTGKNTGRNPSQNDGGSGQSVLRPPQQHDRTSEILRYLPIWFGGENGQEGECAG